MEQEGQRRRSAISQSAHEALMEDRIRMRNGTSNVFLSRAAGGTVTSELRHAHLCVSAQHESWRRTAAVKNGPFDQAE